MWNCFKRISNLPQLKTAGVLLIMLAILSGCGGGKAEIDLDRVLEVFEVCLKEPMPSSETGRTVQDVTPTAQKTGRVLIAEITPEQQNTEMNQAFLNLVSAKLNKAKLHRKPLAIRMDQSGAIIGFTDLNKNMRLDSGDKDIFKIEIDADNERVVATDLVDPKIRRDHRYTGYYHHHYGGGFFMGYMLGSMSGSQYGYYRTYPSRRTNYTGMTMSPKGYAKSRSTSRSARSRGGSRSFRGGK